MKAAINSFGELWEVDSASSGHSNVSFFRVNIRCQDVRGVPESLELMVEDRHFRIPIEIESWEEARPILLGEALDQHLDLVTSEAQDSFLRQYGFHSIPAAAQQRGLAAAPGTHQGGIVEFNLVPDNFPRLPPSPPPLALGSEHPPSPLPQPLIENSTPPSHAAGVLIAGFSVPTCTPGAQPILDQTHIRQPVPQQQGAVALSPGGPGIPSVVDFEPISCLSSEQLLGRPVLVLDKGKQLAHWRSTRLAAKHRGAKKSSLNHAQDLMCKKLKLVRVASKATHSASASSTALPLGGQAAPYSRGSSTNRPSGVADDNPGLKMLPRQGHISLIRSLRRNCAGLKLLAGSWMRALLLCFLLHRQRRHTLGVLWRGVIHAFVGLARFL